MTASIAPQVEKTTIWQIDPAHTVIEFAVKHMMFATVKGRFGGVHGTIVEDTADPSRSSVEVEIDAASIDTREEKRDAHLRSPDFLDVQIYPTITFKSSRVERAGQVVAAAGQLILHVRRDVRDHAPRHDAIGLECLEALGERFGIDVAHVAMARIAAQGMLQLAETALAAHQFFHDLQRPLLLEQAHRLRDRAEALVIDVLKCRTDQGVHSPDCSTIGPSGLYHYTSNIT